MEDSGRPEGQAAPPHHGVARESLTLRLSEHEQVVEVVRQPRHLGGTQGFWCCPKCSALRSHLYVVDGALACRVCHRLDYRSRHVLHPAVLRVAKLRRKLGALPSLLAPLPPRPRNHWAAARYDHLARELAVIEAALVARLRDTVRAVRRRRPKHDRRSNRAS